MNSAKKTKPQDLASLNDHYGRTTLERSQFAEELVWPLTVLADNSLDFAFNYKQEVYFRLRDYIDSAMHSTGGEFLLNEDDLMLLLLQDYEAFCAFFYRVLIVNPKTHEKRLGSLYPSPAQAELVNLIETKKVVYCLFSRQSGKSTTLSTYAIFHALRYPGSTLNLLAPTEDQLEVMKDVYYFLNEVKFLRDKYVGKSAAGKELNKTKVKFAYNGSSIIAKNVGPHQGGDYKRGMRGTCFVDEWTLLSEKTIKKLLQPLQANMYADVKLIYTGTPMLDYNPRAQQTAEDAAASEDIGFLHVGCWENIELGATSRQAIANIFQQERIPCDFGKKGSCPRFFRDGGNFIEPDPELSDFQCNQACYEYDDFVMEYLAEFPAQGSRMFPKKWILDCIDPDLRLMPLRKITVPTKARIMSVDLGFVSDPTVILICDQVFNHLNGGEALRVVGWYELKPESEGKLGTDPARDRIQELFHLYKPNRLYVDATRNEEFVRNLWNSGRRIPRQRFYANDTLKKRGDVGVYWHGDGKHQMVLNHRVQIQAGAWVIPGQSSEFSNRWFDDHNTVVGRPADHGRYKVYPDTGHTFDAAIMASLWLDGKGKGVKPFGGLIYS